MTVVPVIALVSLLLIVAFVLWFLMDRRLTAIEAELGVLERQLKSLKKGRTS